MTIRQRPTIRLADIRRAVADYMRSEGCACCRDSEAHMAHAEALGKLLRVPRYADGSGRDFAKFRSRETRR